MDSVLLQELYLRFHRDVYLFLYSILRNAAAAEDLMQDVFLHAIVSLPDDHLNFHAWLFLVARNLAIDFLRKEKRSFSDSDLFETHAEVQTVAHLTEQKLHLYTAILRLPGMMKDIILLHYFGGFSQKEIAVILKTTHDTVRTLARRARNRLRKELES